MILGSCSAQKESLESETEPVETNYATAAPDEDQAPDFETYFRSVRLVLSVAYYRQADFWSAPGLPDSLLNSDFWSTADSVSMFTESTSGTATVLAVTDDQLAVVTAAHVVEFPDTIKVYHYDEGGLRHGIRVIAVKVRQQTYLPGLGGGQDLDLLASDTKADIAVLAQDYRPNPENDMVFPMVTGKAADLEWGSFVYVLGYPTGRAMMTSGMVSQPDRDDEHSFLLDIAFNKGMSGGPVFARRTGSSEFECVGLVTSGSASNELLLVPNLDDARPSMESGEPYHGEIFARQQKRLQYGVTVAVSIESVRGLLAEVVPEVPAPD